MWAQSSMTARSKKIVRVSLVGIIANILLTIFKTIVGLLSNSIAIVLDAVNNLSDVMSSVVTIIGAHFAGKEPDRKHPMGHGRSEYISATIIAILILYIGLTALVESVRKIISPEQVNYSVTTVIVVVAAIFVKVAVGIYYRRSGKKLESHAILNSGLDALYDAVISIATLIAIVIYFACGLCIEPFLAAGISIFIIVSGIRMLREAFSIILGERMDATISRKIKNEISKRPEVKGAFDLVAHDYGSGMIIASVNIELDCRLDASEIDDISRTIQKEIYRKYRVLLSSIGIYAINLHDPTIKDLWQRTKSILDKYEHVIQMHGFHVDLEEKEISFDVVIDFAVNNRRNYYQKIQKEVRRELSDYTVNITLDSDFSD